ncbi:MAG: tetratricopeptide repeat protein [Cyanobacteria bacterium J06621_11]
MISDASKQQLRQYVLRSAWPQVADLCQRLLSVYADERLYVLLGEACFHQDQYDAAIEAYSQGLKVRTEQPESHYALAVLYSKQQKEALAICHYQLALQHSPGWQKAALGLAQLFHRLGDADQALDEYRQIVQQDPSCAKAHFSMGLLYEQKGEDLLAIKSYRQTTFVQPDHVNAFRHLGAALARMEAHDAAIDVYQQAIALCCDQAKLYINLGQAYQAKGEKQQAIEAYKQALKLEPTQAIAHRNLGHLNSAAQALPQALDHFQQAVGHAVGQNYLAAASDYAWLLTTTGQWDDLLNCFERTVTSATEFVSAYCSRVQHLPDDDLLFRLQRASGLFLEDVLSARSAAVLKPQLALVYERLADLSMACDAPARAEQYYQFALSLSPESWHLYQALGDCLQIQGRYPGAIAVYQAGLLQSQRLLSSERTQDLTNCLATPVTSYVTSPITLSAGGAACLDTFDGTLDGKKDISENVVSYVVSYTEPSALSTLFTLAEAQLKQSIRQASAAQKAAPAVSVRGVYAKAQDWLTVAGFEQPLATMTETSAVRKDSVNVEPFSPVPVDTKCGGLTCQLCMTDLIRKFSPVQVADSAFRCDPFRNDLSAPAGNDGLSGDDTKDGANNDSVGANKTADVSRDDDPFSLAHFAVTIPNGRAWIAPQKDAWAVCNEIAIFSPDNFLLGNLSRCYPWYLPGCQRHAVNSHSIFQRQTPLPDLQKLSGRVAVLSGLSGHIYYHWLFDVLPRFKVLYEALQAQNRSLEEIDYFVVNSVSKPFQRETLQRLGIPMEKVIESDRIPHFEAEALVVPSFAGQLDWVPPSSMDFLRQAFLERAYLKRDRNLAETVESFGKRIYISRAGAKYRHVFNEAAVVELLSSFGFVSVALETLSVVEQARLFSAAEVIVGAHGSGLSNLAFCSPGAKVIEFFSPNYLRTDYWMISEYLQLQHYYIIGQSFDFHPLRQLMYPSGLTEDFSIDLTALRSLITQMQVG